MSSISLVFRNNSHIIEYSPGEKLLNILQRSGTPLAAPCGGKGKCGKCRVDIVRNGRRETVLACKTEAEDGMRVELFESKAEICDGFLLSGAYTPDGQGIGLAVDIGTTTVAMQLIELSSGKVLAAASEMNAQKSFGADVISRAQYTMCNSDGLDILSDCINIQLQRMMTGLGTNIDRAFGAGNTIMQHIAAKLPPESIAVAPYKPLSLFAEGREEGGRSLAPCIAGYVGGDITAGILATGLHNNKKPQLFIDLGTNGEMALGGKDGIVCCSVASGPAFEGAGISCGMASTAGAISHIRYENGVFDYSVIGGTEAKGLCGSGIIELTALLLKLGIIDGSGWLQSPDLAEGDFGDILGEDEDGNGLVYITRDKSVYFTARDVRQIQLAKAAVSAGIEILMEEADIEPEDIEKLYLAGGFGTYIDIDSAVTIGMLPEKLRNKTLSVGNSSLAGAALALCSTDARRELFDIPPKCRYIELSGDRRFNDRFADNMAFYDD